MNKHDFRIIVKNLKTTTTKYSPEILTGLGVAGMITATVLAVRATPKALILMEEREETLAELEVYELTPVEVVKTTWKCYIPSVVIGSVSIACLIGANSVNFRRNAALATAYTLSETALKEYQEKVVETIGEKKERTVRDSVDKSKIERNPATNNEIIFTEKGNTLCFDPVSGRYFKTDIDVIKKAENKLNRDLLDEMYISLNDFYYEVGLSGISIGNELGWNVDDGYIDLSFSAQLSEDDTPCLVLNYGVAPRYNYSRNY